MDESDLVAMEFAASTTDNTASTTDNTASTTDNTELASTDTASTTDNTESTSTDTAPVYGYIGHGEYVTPYQTTIFYHENSTFETSIAFLADRAQIIPLVEQPDFDALAESCEYLTPEVVVFADIPSSAIKKFHDRGFNFVHVFSYNDSLSTDTVTVNADTVNANADTVNVNADTVSASDKYVVFGVDSIYDHVVTIPGLLPMIALEHVIAANFSNYKPNFNVTRVDGQLLCQYFTHKKLHIGRELLKMTMSYKGFEELNRIVLSQRAAAEERERLANERLAKAGKFSLGAVKEQKCFAVHGGDLVNEMMSLAPVHPALTEATFVLFWEFVGANIVATLFGLHDAPSALETLRPYALDRLEGTHGVAKAICGLNILSPL